MAFVPCESIIKFESTTPKKASFQSHPAGYSRNEFQSTSVVSSFLLGITDDKSCVEESSKQSAKNKKRSKKKSEPEVVVANQGMKDA
jgi:hypothetical protein